MNCKKCDSPINWIKKVGRWYCLNPDGTAHWDLCAKLRSKHWTEYKEVSSGVKVGANYRPDGCDCGLPPWELCRPDCEHALFPTEPNEFDLLAAEHMRAICG